jgi:hydroxymethylpyrimidine pyrophosphatase-like HAD family hydrolase
LTEEGPRTIAVDFDGVIANYDGWEHDGRLGSPRPDVIDALSTLRAEGWKIIVHTCRNPAQIRPYLEGHEIPFDEIHGDSIEASCPKPIANVYWDDRAYRYSGDAKADLEAIRSFRTWNGRI